MRTSLLLAFATATSFAAPGMREDAPPPQALVGIGPASIRLRAFEVESGLMLASLRSQAEHVSPGFLGEIGYFANAPLTR